MCELNGVQQVLYLLLFRNSKIVQYRYSFFRVYTICLDMDHTVPDYLIWNVGLDMSDSKTYALIRENTLQYLPAHVFTLRKSTCK